MARCNGCKDCRKVTAADGFTFLGCFHNPFRGKWVAEIKDCPKANVSDTEDDCIDKCPTVEVPRWIPVTERVPMDDKNVIVCVDGIVTTGYHDERGWFWESDGKAIRRPRVTHWMPLPKPPKGGKQNEAD